MRLVAALAAATALGASSGALGQPTITLLPGEALISVEAEGRSLARPDVMTITAGAVTTGATAAEAVSENAALAQRLIATVRSAGIEARDIQTSQFGVEPHFEGGRDDRLSPEGRPPRIVGYVARNRVEIRLRDLTAAQSLIGRLFEAGANSVEGPRFSLSNERPATRAAERMAIAEARAEAENYAASMGRRLGRLLRISDRRAWTDPGGDERIIISGSRMPFTPIEPGEIETEVKLWVDFALAPE
jgi:uncharacterized protein YggE